MSSRRKTLDERHDVWHSTTVAKKPHSSRSCDEQGRDPPPKAGGRKAGSSRPLLQRAGGKVTDPVGDGEARVSF